MIALILLLVAALAPTRLPLVAPPANAPAESRADGVPQPISLDIPKESN